jgi:hypothetical protein
LVPTGLVVELRNEANGFDLGVSAASAWLAGWSDYGTKPTGLGWAFLRLWLGCLADGHITKRSQWGFGLLGLAWLLDCGTKPTGLTWAFLRPRLGWLAGRITERSQRVWRGRF